MSLKEAINATLRVTIRLQTMGKKLEERNKSKEGEQAKVGK